MIGNLWPELTKQALAWQALAVECSLHVISANTGILFVLIHTPMGGTVSFLELTAGADKTYKTFLKRKLIRKLTDLTGLLPQNYMCVCVTVVCVSLPFA